VINNDTRNSAADNNIIENIEKNQTAKYIIGGKMRYSVLNKVAKTRNQQNSIRDNETLPKNDSTQDI
jgi:hypothetical protein